MVEIVLEATVSGTVDEFNSEAYKAALATSLNITSAEISLEVAAASVRVVATIRPTTSPPERVVEAVQRLVLQLATGTSNDDRAKEISTSFNATFLTVSEPTTSLIVIPAPSPPPPEPSPSLPPAPPPSPPPPPPYYLEWLETGYNSLVVVSATTVFYIAMVVVVMLACTKKNTGLKTLSQCKRLEFVFTVALATEDFISDVLYYYVQVSPCMFEELTLSFECTTFASPALFYLSTTALFLPIFIYALYSGFLRGLLNTLAKLTKKAWKLIWRDADAILIWLWRTDQTGFVYGRSCWPDRLRVDPENHSWRHYSRLNSFVEWDPPYRILDWLGRRLLLLMLTAGSFLTTFGLVPVGLLLWVLTVLVMLFFGVNTKMFALRAYMKLYNRLLFLDDKKRREQQVRDVNFSLLAEVIFESIPQFVIVFVNEVHQQDRRESTTATGPTEAAAGTVFAIVNDTVDDGLRGRVGESLQERVLGFSGLAWFTLVTSLVMIFIELFPFVYRVCKSGSLVDGFYIPVLELDETDVEDVRKFRKAQRDGRQIGKQIAARRRQASGRLRVGPEPGASGSQAAPPSPAPVGGFSTRVVLDPPTEQPNEQPRTDETEMTGPTSTLPPIIEQRHAQRTDLAAIPPIDDSKRE